MRKIVLTFLAMTMAICCAFAFIACSPNKPDDTSSNKPNSHQVTGSVNSGENSGDIGSVGAGENSSTQEHTHVLSDHEAKDPTCTEVGWEAYQTCSECDYTTKVELPALGHKPSEWMEDKAATCAEEGSKHKECLTCKENLQTEKIEKLAHTPAAAVQENKVDATCSKEGSYDEVVYCSVCNGEISRTKKTIDKLAHTPAAAVEENKVDATCSKEGSYDEVVYCSVCNGEISRTKKTIEKLAHTQAAAVEENKVDATCSKEGSYDEVVYCSVCNEEISRTKKTIDKLAHTPAAAVQENKVNATCSKEGSYDEVVYCSVCNGEVSRTKKTIEKSAHNFVNNVCTVCQAFDDSMLLYAENEKGYYVKGLKDGFDKTSKLSLTIPSEHNGKPVTAIGDNAFLECTGLTSVTMGNSITSIGESAFDGCYSLANVTMGNNITSIGHFAFFSCSSLTSIIIPNSVTYIGEYVFMACTSIKYNEYDNALYLGNTENPYLCLISAKNTSITSCNIDNNTRFIQTQAFFRCDKLTSIVIPDSVTTLGRAFYQCTSLKDVTIGKNVTSIETSTFNSCSSLTSIIIPDSVTYIGNSAFYKCTSLTSVKIGNGVTSIEYLAFGDCTSLKDLTIGKNVTYIGDAAFSNCGLLKYNEYDNALYLGNTENPYLCFVKVKDNTKTTYNINSNTRIIYDSAFSDCESLISITLPNSITCIGGSAFSGCYQLTSITIPNGVTSIGDNAFSFCESLKTITLSNSLTFIGDYVFNGCKSLTSITIPENVTTIENSAFEGCSNLTSVTFKNTSGWRVEEVGSQTAGTPIASDQLSNPATAAQYLTSTYVTYCWYRD